MKNCPVCNAPLNDESVFCTQCGAPQQAPAYQTAVPSDFEEIDDDEDLPF